jgi:hypothetical protein
MIERTFTFYVQATNEKDMQRAFDDGYAAITEHARASAFASESRD